MNRTGKCIKMLMLLRKYEKMSSKELSIALETNQRNIREYRKELEEAGFEFHNIRGINGGYQLLNPNLYE